uniref:Cnidarian restricted protein n=1 Tax=Clytia hemisphaerica TaxID=252671 RepID=A0A7M5WKU9_9CNID
SSTFIFLAILTIVDLSFLEVTNKCIKGIPENIHGAKPQISIEEMKARSGGFITSIARQSTEWEISFTVNFHSFGKNESDWHNIFIITNHGSRQSYGIRSPLVTTQNSMLQISSAVNSNYDHKYLKYGLVINKPYMIKISQYYIANGQYKYRIELDGEEVHNTLNNDARQFYDMKFYLLRTNGADCDVSDFKFVNFL